MGIEARQHALQGILGELAAGHRRDVIFLHLLHRILDQAEIAVVGRVGSGARPGAVAGGQHQRDQNDGSGSDCRVVLA